MNNYEGEQEKMSGIYPFFRVNKAGATRTVILLGPYAIKVPIIHHFHTRWWSSFLRGLIGNMQEKDFCRMNRPEILPCLFSVWGGWMNVMPRVETISVEDFLELDYDAWIDRGDFTVPVERKWDSFGWFRGEIVAIDLG